MELVEGPTVSDRVASGPLRLEETLATARQIAEGLEATHEQNIVHRDLKPANIKLRPDGTVKLLDFGLAKSIDGVSTTMPTLMTRPGLILGKASYMSPEQAEGKPVDRLEGGYAGWMYAVTARGKFLVLRSSPSSSDAVSEPVNIQVDWAAGIAK
jgi:serine/threonine-protein kinase